MEWRLLDTGTRNATENIALDETILEARAKNLVPDTIRFLKFSPPAVLVGYHQAIENEVRVSYCQQNGISVQRRITGGGAIYFDATQLGWEVIAKFDSLGFDHPSIELFEKISEGVIAGLKALGIEARFRPRNDIEVNGRKISGTGGTEYRDAFLFQGTLLIDFDAETMVKSLKIPVDKLQVHELDSIKDRVTWLYKELAYRPSLSEIKLALTRGFEKSLKIRLKTRPLTKEEKTIYKSKLRKIKAPSWLDKIKPARSDSAYIVCLKKDKGIVKMLLGVEPRSPAIKYVHFLGDFFATPKDFIYDLESALKFKEFSLTEIERTIKDFFSKTRGELIGFSQKDFIKLFAEAENKYALKRFGISVAEANNLHAVNCSYDLFLTTRVKHLLLPYCAKEISCEFRKMQGCNRCGNCSTSRAHELARKHNLIPITVTSFRHLMKTLRSIHHEKGFIGLCCEQFFVRHRRDFEKYNLPGLFVNIQNQTCFDLELAKEARAGNFPRQTELPIPLLAKILEVHKNA